MKFFVVAMEQAQSSGNHMEPQIVVVAIASGFIGVIIVAMVIYLCCFNARRGQRVAGSTTLNTNKSDLQTNGKRGTKVKHCRLYTSC
jgi:ATP-dependent Zn protease